jgi:hypothetical protein
MVLRIQDFDRFLKTSNLFYIEYINHRRGDKKFMTDHRGKEIWECLLVAMSEGQ